MKLTELKTGDTVVIQQSSGFFERPYLFAVVKEVGAKKIKTDKGDFSTTHGHKWGESSYRGDFIRDDTTVDEAKARNAEIKLEQHRRDLIHKLKEFPWRDLPLEALEQVDAIVTAHNQPRADALKG
jgi:hypothetical protein